MRGLFLHFSTITMLFLLCTSCSERSTKEKFGEFALKRLLSGTNAKDIYLMPSDSILTNDSIFIGWCRRMRDTTEFNEYLNKKGTEINEWTKKSIDLGMNKSNIEFLRVEVDSIQNLRYTQTNLTVYFLVNKKEHFFKLFDVDSLKNKWTAYKIEPPTNEEEVERLKQERRKKEANEPYCPLGIYSIYGNWEYDRYSPTAFSSFFVTMKNGTANNFKRIKVRVSIYVKGKEIFSQIVTKNGDFYAGDVIRFEIFELRNFYLGVDVSEGKNNFDFKTTIVDAKPIPGYEDVDFY